MARKLADFGESSEMKHTPEPALDPDQMEK
jgi:hypothetical protein